MNRYYKFATRRLGPLAVAVLAITAIISSGNSPTPAGAAGNATLIASPSASVVAPSTPFTVTILQHADSTTTGAGADLTFNPAILAVTNVALGGPYAAGSQAVGEAVPAGALAYPNGFGAAETVCGADTTDDDGDGFVNDGCVQTGAPEVACGGTSDDDGDGRANDGCAASGPPEVNQCATVALVAADDELHTDGNRNDGCAAVGGIFNGGENLYQCEPGNNVDDDSDGRKNDGCIRVGGPEAETECTEPGPTATDNDSDGAINDGCLINGPQPETGGTCAATEAVDSDSDGFLNDGCPASGSPETGADCSDLVDDDSDTFFNDGCAAVSAENQGLGHCSNATDDDGDGVENDGCRALGGPEQDMPCQDLLDNEPDGSFNDGCPTQAGAAESGTACTAGNTTDDDGDNYVNDGCAAVSTSEATPPCTNDVDDDVDGSKNDGCSIFQQGEPAGATCTNTSDDDADEQVNDGCAATGIANEELACGNAVDDDGDGTSLINDGCPIAGVSAEVACGNAINDDPGDDGLVNDGCPAGGAQEVNQCTGTGDDDDDGLVNDGCEPWGQFEAGDNCTNATDDDGDGAVNDGCLRAAPVESGGACSDTVDSDGDTYVNDGCREAAGASCTDGIDSDADLVIDDGCFPPSEMGSDCDDYVDNDVDGLINDGCVATEAGAIAKANALGTLDHASAFFTPGGGSVPPGAPSQKAVVVISMSSLAVNCMISPLTLSNGEILDVNGEPTSTLGVVSSQVLVASSPDCDGDLDLNAADNCPTVGNAGQENADANFVDTAPPQANDDGTWANSDGLGDVCDPDADNDGIPNATETGGTPCGSASGATDPLEADTDGDRRLDGAECALGFDPDNGASAPPAVVAPDADADGAPDALDPNDANIDSDADGIRDGVELRGYNTSLSSINTDGDACAERKELATVDSNSVVNAADLGNVAARFGSYAIPWQTQLNGTARWNADLDKNGTVNAADLGLVAAAGFGGC